MEPEGTDLLRYIKDEVSEEERVWIEGWLKEDEVNEKTLQQVAAIYYVLNTHQRIVSRDPMAAYEKVCHQIKTRSRRFWLKRVSAIAACFIGILLISSVLSFWYIQSAGISTQQFVTVQANAGMRTHFNLPDGTIAYLNSGSTLTYPLPYDKKERKVSLSGEAYFKVAHNEMQPFVVSVANDRMRVNVLGTEFNLKSYKDERVVETTLVSGSVKIEMLKNGNVVSGVKLKPSEKAVYNIASGTVSIASVNTEYDTAWKDGRLMFKDMTLPEVLKKLAYFYNVKFDVKDPVINSYCFTGTFENKQLSQVLDYLKISSRIDYTIEHVKSDDSLKVQHTTVVLKKE